MGEKRHIAKMNRITEMDLMAEQREIDSRMPVIKCPLGCRVNHGINEFNWECRACLMQAGRTVLLPELDKSMPMFTQIWKRKLNEEKGDAHKVTVLIDKLQASEAKLQDSEGNLKASEAKLTASEAKLKAVEARLKDAEAQIQTHESTLKAEAETLRQILNKPFFMKA